MSKIYKNTMHLDFCINKEDGSDFTEKELEDFLDSFIDLVESKNYGATGSSAYYVEEELELVLTTTEEDG